MPSSIDNRARLVFLFLRSWFSSRHLNSAADNTLSTFSWSLMIIHALQNTQPPLLNKKAIQEAWPKQANKTSSASSSSSTATSSSTNSVWTTSNRQTVTELIYHFFQFYSEYDARIPIQITDQDQIEIKTSSASSSSSSRRSNPSNDSMFLAPCLRLVDPISPNENTARSMQSHHWQRVRREIKRAKVILQQQFTTNTNKNSNQNSNSSSSSSFNMILSQLLAPLVSNSILREQSYQFPYWKQVHILFS
jgi:DNA polymerase sigma